MIKIRVLAFHMNVLKGNKLEKISWHIYNMLYMHARPR